MIQDKESSMVSIDITYDPFIGFSIMNGGADNNVRAEACGKFETTCRSSFKDPMYVASYVICAHY